MSLNLTLKSILFLNEDLCSLEELVFCWFFILHFRNQEENVNVFKVIEVYH